MRARADCGARCCSSSRAVSWLAGPRLGLHARAGVHAEQPDLDHARVDVVALHLFVGCAQVLRRGCPVVRCRVRSPARAAAGPAARRARAPAADLGGDRAARARSASRWKRISSSSACAGRRARPRCLGRAPPRRGWGCPPTRATTGPRSVAAGVGRPAPRARPEAGADRLGEPRPHPSSARRPPTRVPATSFPPRHFIRVHVLQVPAAHEREAGRVLRRRRVDGRRA